MREFVCGLLVKGLFMMYTCVCPWIVITYEKKEVFVLQSANGYSAAAAWLVIIGKRCW